MPKFIHLRETTTVNKLSGPVEELSPTGGATIAYERNAQHVVYAFTRCNKLDNFCKHTGRAKAAGRLKSPVWRRVITLSRIDATRQEIHQVLINEVAGIIQEMERDLWSKTHDS